MIDILGKEWLTPCLGCSITHHEIDLPGGILYETNHFLLHQDPANPIPGFLIIALKAHKQSIAAFTREEADELVSVLYKTRHAMKEIEGIEYCTILQEERAQHYHAWIVPHYRWMENIDEGGLGSIYALLKYSKEHWKTKEMIAYVLATAGKIKELLNHTD
jgi:diadenosine tetraphosphate (Ap4A) HIT family hydrolase